MHDEYIIYIYRLVVGCMYIRSYTCIFHRRDVSPDHTEGGEESAKEITNIHWQASIIIYSIVYYNIEAVH